MAEYRPVPEDRREARERITSYAFAAGSGPYDPEETDERLDRMWSFGERRGMFDGDELLVVSTVIERTARLRGAWVPMAGVSGVASPPENRHRGLVGEMLREALVEYRDRGWPLAVLRPFHEPFYAKYGWATGVRRRSVTVDPAALSVTRDAAAGEFERVTADEHERLHDPFEAWLDGVPLATRRGDDWWRDRAFQSFDDELYGYAWVAEGDVRGYLLYEIDDATMRVHELAHRDHAAYLNLLRFCYNHDAQVEEVEIHGPADDRILDVVPDRDAVDLEYASGYMVRIVDVPAALEVARYPGVDGAEITLSVTDGNAPWNDTTFAISVDDGTATVSTTDRPADAAVDVGTLSQLLVGYHDVEDAAAVGDLEVFDPETGEVLASLFPRRDPYMPDSF